MAQIIGDFSFIDDGPIGITYGFNASHTVEPQLMIDMVALGASRVRYNVVIDLIAPSSPSSDPTTWNWSFLDDAVQRANAVGMRVTLIARGVIPTTKSAWTVQSPCDPNASPLKYPTTAANYALIACVLARRYSGDGNPENAIVGGKRLQADNIEIGNEEFSEMQDTSTNPKWQLCQNPMKFVNYVRTVLPALRKPAAQGGGGWVPRGNFLARVGAWGITHSIPAETIDHYTKMCAPPTDATWNPSGDHSSIFGFNGTLNCQLLDYANFHNYNTSGYTPDVQVQDIRTILNHAGNTTIPIWCTEGGVDGPVAGASEASQAAYFAANPDGTGGGMLASVNANGLQHWDIFTINYLAQTTGVYTGQAKAIACKDSAASSGFIRFQAFQNIVNYFKNVDKGAWAAQAVPKGFGSQGSGGGGGGGGGGGATSGSLLWLAYFYPTDPSNTGTYWTEAKGTAPLTPRVFVFNNGNGPGASADSNFAASISAAHAQGQQVIGYVNSSNFTTMFSVASIKADIDKWYSFYPSIDGIMLDTALPTSGNLSNYTTLYTYIKGKGGTGLVVINPAALAPESYFSTPACDVCCIFEDEYSVFQSNFVSNHTAAWMQNYTPDRFWVIVGTVPDTASISSVVTTALAKNVGRYYITSIPSQSSYNQMPSQSYFNTVVADVYGSAIQPPPQGGSLVGSFAALSGATINLTNESGTGDWAHWGLTNGTTFDHKSSGGSQISNFAALGNGVPVQNPNTIASFTWTDGTPDATATASATGSKITPPTVGG